MYLSLSLYTYIDIDICIDKIEAAIKAIDGIISVSIDLAKKQVYIYRYIDRSIYE